uniref:Uncharacterized protein n=1 Tax=Arundo donax TaxID=35708 RepID=A0A0A9AHJ5_ARUDO
MLLQYLAAAAAYRPGMISNT